MSHAFTGIHLLTKCAARAAPLAHDAPRCVRCHTRYCNKTCQQRRTLRLRYWLADALLHAGTDKAMIREAIEVFEDTSSMDVGYYAPYQVRLDSGALIYVKDPPKQMRAIA